ncbi:ABC transporter permease [Ensifer sp. NM-2]|uniref:ABC transporter permease n=1 Tax=Ensifer sp. NM-2 TaxID=2109730 RepID=UPI000D135F6F|nr:ABC transporter permease [Ensifer sp. NM-2]PSS60137.1 ABC transporter permease [Ensifer sp. NM-2]
MTMVPSAQRRGVSLLPASLRSKPGPAVAVAFLVLIVVVAASASFLPYDAYRQDLLHRNSPPSWNHLLGTDELGRDMLARLAIGARVSLVVAVTSTVAAVLIGIAVGAIAGYRRGWIDSVCMRFVDSMYAFPDTLFAILIAGIVKGQLSQSSTDFFSPITALYKMSGGLFGVFLTLSFTSWLICARIVRAEVIILRSAEYVAAARLAGASDLFVMRRHILPNCLPVIIVSATFVVPSAILLEAGLSFLGVGVDPPTPSWGAMIASGVRSMQSYPHLLVTPAIAVGLTLLSINVLGDALREHFDPSFRRGGETS